MSGHVPILMYHQVMPRPPAAFRRWAVTPGQFARQMRLLALLGYRAVGLDTLLAHRDGVGSLPARPVVLTFDDGYQGCVDYAVPVLRRHGFTATFFLVTDRMGGEAAWLVGELGIELHLPLMNWDAARRLVADGFEVGAHTCSHPHLTQLAPDACRRELVDSRRALEAALGREVRLLAYPYGEYDKTVRSLAAEAGYTGACSTRSGHSPADDDPLALRRVEVLGNASLLDFVVLLRTARSLHHMARRAHRAARRSVEARSPKHLP